MGETGRSQEPCSSNLRVERRRLSLKEYEAPLDMILPLMAAAGYWGKPVHRKLWQRCFQQLVTPRSGPFPGLAVEMDYYPAYLVLYAFGIAAMAGGRPGNLAYILGAGQGQRRSRAPTDL